MDIRKLFQDKNELRLLVTGTDAAMMNALRRTMTNNVFTLAVENASVYENTSVMADEMLVHRLGLLSIATTGKIKEGDKATFGLEKEGPGMVYSGDIQCATGNAEIVDKKIPIVLLGKDQKVRLELEAVAGNGKAHAKWQPGLASYKQLPKLVFENVKNPEAIAKAFPGMLEIKAKKLFLADPTDAQRASEIRDRFADQVTLSYDDKSYVLSIETNGGCSTTQILESAIESLKEKNRGFKEALKSL